MQLVRTEQELAALRSENAKLNEMLKLERNRKTIHENHIVSMEYEMKEQSRKLGDRENMIKDLQRQNNQKQCTINELEVEIDRLKRVNHSKFAEAKKNQLMVKELKENVDCLNVSSSNYKKLHLSMYANCYLQSIIRNKNETKSELFDKSIDLQKNEAMITLAASTESANRKHHEQKSAQLSAIQLPHRHNL